jgi:hypothetical protein
MHDAFCVYCILIIGIYGLSTEVHANIGLCMVSCSHFSAVGRHDTIYAERRSMFLQAAHVPYRNSKLTFALQDMLSGSAKVLSIVQVSPAETNAQESLCTLEFAARVSQISMVLWKRK